MLRTTDLGLRIDFRKAAGPAALFSTGIAEQVD
jgi:hypothetical protein